MNYKNIVASIKYSPNMIWQLSKYDKLNDQKIKKVKLTLFLLIASITIISSHYLIDRNYKEINSQYNNNIQSTNNSLNDSLIDYSQLVNNQEILSIIKNINQNSIYQSLINKPVNNLEIIKNPILYGNWYEFSANNLYHDSQRLNFSNPDIFVRQAQKKYYGQAVRISPSDHTIIILQNGNILSNDYNVVNNNRLDLTGSFDISIDVKNSTQNKSSKFLAESGDNLVVDILITKKQNQPNLEKIVASIDDFLEYSDLISNQKVARGLVEISLPNKINQEIRHTLIFKVKDDLSKTSNNLNIPTSYDCQLELKVIDSKIKVPVDCSLTSKITMQLAKQNNLEQSQLSHITKIVVFSLISVMIIKLFYLIRLTIIKREIRKIRSNINQGIA